MYVLKERSKEEMMENFMEDAIMRYIESYDITLSDWIDKTAK